jgi:hypothetical protein
VSIRGSNWMVENFPLQNEEGSYSEQWYALSKFIETQKKNYEGG